MNFFSFREIKSKRAETEKKSPIEYAEGETKRAKESENVNTKVEENTDEKASIIFRSTFRKTYIIFNKLRTCCQSFSCCKVNLLNLLLGVNFSG